MKPYDEFDDETHMSRALELAREAAARGDRPFGSVLVRNDALVAEASNHVVTEEDIRRHPELDLAMRACRELAPAARADTVMYTSTEPCPMCSGGLRSARLGAIVYSVGSAARWSPGAERRSPGAGRCSGNGGRKDAGRYSAGRYRSS